MVYIFFLYIMEVNQKLIEHVAEVARLKLTKHEIEKFTPQLKEILEAFSKIAKINTGNVKESFQPIELKNFLREDIEEKSLSQEEALANTKHKKDGYFKGPKVI